jgi:hypothetical protein
MTALYRPSFARQLPVGVSPLNVLTLQDCAISLTFSRWLVESGERDSREEAVAGKGPCSQ